MNFGKSIEALKYITDRIEKVSYGSLRSYLESNVGSFPLLVNDIDPNKVNRGSLPGVYLYRARAVVGVNNIPYRKINQLSFIQEKDLHLITSFGRVNKPKQSMFYSAFEPTTAIGEVLRGDALNEFNRSGSIFVVVSKWKIVEPLVVSRIPISEKHFQLFWNTVPFKSNTINVEHIRIQQDRIKQLLPDDQEWEILQFFTDSFGVFDINSPKRYYLSNYYADVAFNRTNINYPQTIDGILYPSVANSYQNNNLVLLPETVEKKLKFDSVLEYWVRKEGDGLEFLPIHQNIKADSEGNLLWP